MSGTGNRSIVVAVCGASGQIYARWVLRTLVETNCHVHLIVSAAAEEVCRSELGIDDIADGLDDRMIRRHGEGILTSPLASGSYPTAGMIICPCSLNTLAALAAGISDNLIKRAGQVHLKQRRPLVIAVREMPVSLIDLENMVRLAHAGAEISPLSPSFYHKPRTIDELVKFTAERLIELVTGVPADDRYTGGAGIGTEPSG